MAGTRYVSARAKAMAVGTYFTACPERRAGGCGNGPLRLACAWRQARLRSRRGPAARITWWGPRVTNAPPASGALLSILPAKIAGALFGDARVVALAPQQTLFT